ncbi:MAG: hypothetical protein RLZZ324_1193, partial [Candidatus Parcubacteria bacterium]
MKLLQPEHPAHAHLRSVRTRFLLPLFLLAVSMAAVSVGAAFATGSAALRDAEAAAHALAVSSSGVIRDGNDPAAQLPKDAEFAFIDTHGMVLRGSARFMPGTRLADDALLTEVLSRKDGAATLKGEDGVRRVFGFTAMRDGQTGYAVMDVPLSAAFAQARSALLSWSLIGALLLLIALWAAASLGDFLLVHRIHLLADAMRAVASGDLDAEAGLVRGLGELDEVTVMFGQISDKFKKTLDTTETTVHKRTVELEFNKDVAELDKARVEALLTSVGDSLLATDTEGKLTFMNKEAERQLGYASRELVNQDIAAVLRLTDEKGTDISPEMRPTAVALKTGQPAHAPGFPKPWYFVRKDGTHFPAQITVSPVLVGGRVAGAITAFRDITAEMEFDRRKSEFVSIASHQLRAPLSATKWLADMLRKGDAGPLVGKQQELADKMFEANER